MKRNFFPVLLIMLMLSIGCSMLSKKETPAGNAAPATTATATPVPSPSPSATEAGGVSTEAPKEPNLLSFANGALIVRDPTQYSGWPTIQMFDDSEEYGWASEKGKTTDQVTVIELRAKTIFTSFNFDTAHVDTEGAGAKDLTVEISDTDATSGFQNILTATLEDKKDNQSFKPSADIPGRWVRLTIKNNHGSADYNELMEFRGWGKQDPTPPLENISGTYDTSYGKFHVKQEGTSVVGCYEYDLGLLEGGIENRVMTLTWSENEKHDKKGPALMVFSPDGKVMTGMWKMEHDERWAGVWNGKKISNDVGNCPHLPNLSKANAAGSAIEKNIAESGRARIYGINFDSNSDIIREESKSTLTQIVDVLKQNAAWKITVEGHTDNVGGEAFNKSLSERRAAAVKDFLVKAGIDETRLTAAGFGLSKPVAPNDSESGRAQNRRVELVKQ